MHSAHAAAGALTAPPGSGDPAPAPTGKSPMIPPGIQDTGRLTPYRPVRYGISMPKRIRLGLLIDSNVADQVLVLAWWLRWHPSHLWGIALCLGGRELIRQVRECIPTGSDPIMAPLYGWQRWTAGPGYRERAYAYGDPSQGPLLAHNPRMIIPDDTAVAELERFAGAVTASRQSTVTEVYGWAVQLGGKCFQRHFCSRISAVQSSFGDRAVTGTA